MSRTPLVDAWRRALIAKRRPMQVPGHKMRYTSGAQGWAADLVGDMVRDDIPLQGGVDDNAFTNRYLDQAEALWADAVGADHCRFLVGGSSQGNIAALGTVADQDVPIAVDRTSHRSTQAALVISGARPVWIYPRLHPEFHLPIGMEASSISRRHGRRERLLRHLAVLHRHDLRRREPGRRPRRRVGSRSSSTRRGARTWTSFPARGP